MKLVISWDQTNGIGFRLKSSSAFMGILPALLIYALDGLFLSGSLKTAGMIIVALLLRHGSRNRTGIDADVCYPAIFRLNSSRCIRSPGAVIGPLEDG